MADNNEKGNDYKEYSIFGRKFAVKLDFRRWHFGRFAWWWCFGPLHIDRAYYRARGE